MTALLLGYEDVERARAFFIEALGFDEEWEVRDGSGTLTRSHLRFGDTVLMLDKPGAHNVLSPRAAGGVTHLIVRLPRWLMVAALLAVLVLGACTSGDDGGASPMSSTTPEASLALAGELGPGGGVLWDGRELEGHPDELFEYQDDPGPTVVFASPSTSDPDFYLGAVRSQQSICVSLSAAGKQGPTSQLCDVPAYRSHDEVVEHSFVAEGNIPLDGAPTRVVYGVTYLDVASVSLDDETAPIEVQKGLPFWMQRFFAVAVPDDAAGSLRLLDAEGMELARIPLPTA